jgi:predicted DCC family thiol-disulfide oxidoreductase YuxK
MNGEPLVELYSKDDCHLCDVAKEVMLNVQKRRAFRFIEIKIQPGMPEYEQFKERIPVIFVNKKFAFQYKVTEREFVKLLETT